MDRFGCLAKLVVKCESYELYISRFPSQKCRVPFVRNACLLADVVDTSVRPVLKTHRFSPIIQFGPQNPPASISSG